MGSEQAGEMADEGIAAVRSGGEEEFEMLDGWAGHGEGKDDGGGGSGVYGTKACEGGSQGAPCGNSSVGIGG